MVILGIDPGYATLGYGVVRYVGNKFTVLEYGTVRTAADINFSRRLEQIYDGVSQLIAKYNPDNMAVEQLFFNTNTATAINVAQARGCVMLAGIKGNVPVYERTPLQVKQSVTGYGNATKSQVMEMTRILLNLEKIPKPDDAADALAIAICQAHCSGSLLGKLNV